MRSAIIIAIGFAVLGVFLLAGRYVGSTPAAMSRAALYFLPVWLAAAGINMWVGVTKGYTVGEEAPIFAVIFALPAAAALFVWWRLSRS
jgi:hypothetical protein